KVEIILLPHVWNASALHISIHLNIRNFGFTFSELCENSFTGGRGKYLLWYRWIITIATIIKADNSETVISYFLCYFIFIMAFSIG
ncbi:hypothetical protein L9F63_008150, partial [Diploptera punctata]